MHGLKVGDRVSLVGEKWDHKGGNNRGTVHTIIETDEPNYVRFADGHDWVKLDPGWEVELNTDSPAEHFAKTAAKFANDPISTEDAEKLKALGEKLGISPRTLTNGDTETTQTFAMNVNRITNKLANMLIEKNQQYSNSALDPIRVFSQSDRMEQLRVRADDKLSRIRNGDTSEDAVMDLAGYLVLLMIARESE